MEVVFSILFVQLVTAYVVANPTSPYNTALLDGANEAFDVAMRIMMCVMMVETRAHSDMFQLAEPEEWANWS